MERLSMFEVERLRQIERNNLVLAALGLGKAETRLQTRRGPRRMATVARMPVRLFPRRAGQQRRQYAELHLFGRDLAAWPLQLPPTYSKRLRLATCEGEDGVKCRGPQPLLGGTGALPAGAANHEVDHGAAACVGNGGEESRTVSEPVPHDDRRQRTSRPTNSRSRGCAGGPR